MTWLNALVVFICVWWVVLFMVLPWGVRPVENPEPGHEPGAPEKPMLWRKVIATTLLSFVVWGVIYLLVELELFSFRDMVAG
ncbi:DUF1467 family protein [Aquibaculum arenosum]|uniref:DUF1467 family protein n=1 Tax=Aquibaculum arenosum TaxID=3032591 RepID=A0ABT5YQD7_9PROT|nr:DUF1467 family protein [Fodinicurvata sp. CAU 1616]MDF2097183.1 DUF1467 family protein [Fodinicurvata sp. CAU 1616]